MKPSVVTSTANPLCREIIALRQRKHRRRMERFVLEGVHGVVNATEAGCFPEKVMVSDGFAATEEGRRMLDRLMTLKKLDIVQVPDPLMARLSDTETPQGLLGVFPLPSYSLEKELQNPEGLWLVLDRIQDAGNLGTLIRSAEAAGARGIILTHGTADPFSGKALRAATGAQMYLPVVELTGEDDPGWLLKSQGLTLVAAALEKPEAHLPDPLPSAVALIIGNESNGIDPSLLDQADVCLTIPMRGRIQSLNAAVAGSVLLFHLAALRDRP